MRRGTKVEVFHYYGSIKEEEEIIYIRRKGN
jgi:hypothetical protein